MIPGLKTGLVPDDLVHFQSLVNLQVYLVVQRSKR